MDLKFDFAGNSIDEYGMVTGKKYQPQFECNEENVVEWVNKNIITSRSFIAEVVTIDDFHKGNSNNLYGSSARNRKQVTKMIRRTARDGYADAITVKARYGRSLTITMIDFSTTTFTVKVVPYDEETMNRVAETLKLQK